MSYLSPLYWLDLTDKNGHPDNQKIIPLGFLVLAIYFHAIENPFAWWELLLLGTIAFGARMYGLFLRRSSVSIGLGATVSTSEARSEVHTEQRIVNEIINRRDVEAGIDPA